MMRNTLRILLLAALLGAGFWLRSLPPVNLAPGLAAWWPWGTTTTVTLYFADGRFLFPVSRQMPTPDDNDNNDNNDDNDDLPRLALQALLAGPSAGSRLTSPIPSGVEIRAFTLADGVAHVDLSAAFLAEHDDTNGRGAARGVGAPASPVPRAAAARGARGATRAGVGAPRVNNAAKTAVVETLTALPGVTAVALSVEGKPLAEPARRVPLLYYASANGLVAVPVPVTDPRAALTMYLSDPPDPKLTSLPRDVRLLRYEYDPADGLLALEFNYTSSLRALALEKPDRIRLLLLGLIAGLTEFPNVRAVQLDFGGQTRLGLGQCSDLLLTPQPRPALLNDERLLGRVAARGGGAPPLDPGSGRPELGRGTQAERPERVLGPRE